jgi:sarcosine oxidase subunit alpha
MLLIMDNRITSHPILRIEQKDSLKFFWQEQVIYSYPGETISSALIANGINIFGHHTKDNSPLGIFCANGQCSQCMVILDGLPVKACMTLAKQESHVIPANGLPILPYVNDSMAENAKAARTVSTKVMIIGGGPAGLSAAIELGNLGISTLLIDDKHKLGGKLVLQTHRFFGSFESVYAGTRGINIATLLEEKVHSFTSVQTWINSTAIAVFEDKSVGVWYHGSEYVLVKPEILLVTTGARERSLAFPGNTLPGVIGAGAFQTLVNRDLVRPSANLFIIGGGNVGLITGYHALQANINVVGLVEALPECGGYKVHRDKLARLGVPIYTSHTILCANGTDGVDSITIAKVDKEFRPISGTERTQNCDSILVAVGLDPVNEFISKAKEVKLTVFAAGDANEIAEASAAIYSGKIIGNEIARELGYPVFTIPEDWIETEKILKSKPGQIQEQKRPPDDLVFPVMHCTQEIPCDPCSNVCPNNLIRVDKKDIRKLPEFCPSDEKNCIACERCVAICPGLAITLVDFRKDLQSPIVSIPLEFSKAKFLEKDTITVTDVNGLRLADLPIVKLRQIPVYPGTVIVRVKAPAEIASKIAGVELLKNPEQDVNETNFIEKIENDTYICRCERVTAIEIRDLISSGIRDINQIKALTKASMGACGGKTCLRIINALYKEEGVSLEQVTQSTVRPLFVEIPVSILAGLNKELD